MCTLLMSINYNLNPEVSAFIQQNTTFSYIRIDNSHLGIHTSLRARRNHMILRMPTEWLGGNVNL